MAKAKKLPSGNWRVQVFSHYEIIKGEKKRKYRSFTAPDKRSAERKALEWSLNRPGEPYRRSILDCVDLYVSAKNGVLSPSTVRAYTSYKKHHLDEIGLMMVDSLDEAKLQRWVSSLSETLSPKTVKEIVTLVSSSVYMATKKRLDLTLPQPVKSDQHTPTDEELKKVLNKVNDDMKLCILLSAFCSLRRGEICALTDKDVSGEFVSVSKTMVRDVTGDWIIKEPKTPGSVRTVPIPEGIRELIKGRKGKLVPYNPDELTKKFRKAVGCKYRFHDLRHYYASTAHYLGVPDAYIMANGGWKTDSVMKRVYREALEDKKKEENQKIADHFKKLF